ncbi:glycosyltransferase family 1 protein [Parabacteroides sp. TM07-1AC]|uniref:glycosyltransferase family 4 protein n=1 Tax=Parabacteroides sp. TM07-1AC TaxID=2292363 RepID=UPI000F00E715|nr:glycosyltransferase family 4 protein [Parabacteroides sp. TM07-1AC]RHU22562.1 glycosyltransferase family 1 protein [Parabacteroides sp. TM07-1AC]
MDKKYIFHCMCYSPKVYSGLDRFTLMLANKLAEDHYQNIFLFYDTLEYAPVYREELTENGHTIVLLDSKSGTLKLLKEYLTCFNSYKPAIVHVHFTSLFKLLNCFLRLFYHFKLFISFHSTVNPCSSYKKYRKQKGFVKTLLYTWYCRFIYQQSNAIICVSQAVKRQYLQFLHHNRKVKCLYLGVNPTITSQEKAKRILHFEDETRFRICHISAFEHLKGIDIIIEAAALLKEKYQLRDFKVYLIGTDRRNDNYSKMIKELSARLQVREHIVWLGKRFDIQYILPAFDVYIHPSRQEGIGVSLMEAASAGLPLIGTRVGGIPEVIAHESNGFLIKSESAVQLAHYLYKLYQDKKIHREMAIRSKERWNDSFNIEKQTNKLYQIYINA